MLFFSGRRLARLAFHAAVALGCASAIGACAADASPDMPEQAAGTGGNDDEGRLQLGITDPLSGQTVEFGDDARIVRPPNSVTHLWVQTEPFRLVRTALLANGDQTPGSAALDGTQFQTDGSGRVALRLTAPPIPTSFLLRVWVDGIPPRQVEVTIAQIGSASVRVIPLYVGKRPIQRWTASAIVDQDCAKLLGSPPPDGEYANEPMDPPQLDVVTIANVPVGPRLAILIRAAEYAWGCANLQAALEGEMNTVQVTVTDVPMHLSTQALDLNLTLPSRAAWTPLFEAPIGSALDAMLDGAADDVEALLDAMQAALGSAARSEFSDMREASGWDVQLRAALGAATAATSVRAPLERWMRAGLAEMKLDPAFETRLSADASDDPKLTLEESFGFEAESVHTSVVGSPRFNADARDSVLLGADLELDPARLLLSSAEGQAEDEVDGAANVSEALAELVSCDVVADTLIGYGLNTGDANAECDADCALDLCREAIAELVSRAGDATRDAPARIELAVSGPGQVGERAELLALDGNWLGRFTRGDVAADLAGSATASSD
jgi:hypothetical protein